LGVQQEESKDGDNNNKKNRKEKSNERDRIFARFCLFLLNLDVHDIFVFAR
jgi:hypothetical protein